MTKRKERELDALERLKEKNKRKKLSPAKTVGGEIKHRQAAKSAVASVFSDSDISDGEGEVVIKDEKVEQGIPEVVEIGSSDEEDEDSEDDEVMMRRGLVDDLENGDDDALFYSDPDDDDSNDNGDLDGFIGTHEDDLERVYKKKKKLTKMYLDTPISSNSKRNGKSPLTDKETTELLTMIGDFFEDYIVAEVKTNMMLNLENLWVGFNGRMRKILGHHAFKEMKKHEEISNVLPILKRMENQFDTYEKAKKERTRIRRDLDMVYKEYKEHQEVESLHDAITRKA